MRATQSGFSLLEAMVAITVLSSVSFAVFSWVNQSIQMLLRADSVMTQELLVNDLLAEIEVTDLTMTNQGELVRDGLRLYWHSEHLETRQGKTNAGFTGFHDIRLDEISVDVFRDELVVANYTFRVANSRLVRMPRQELRL